MHAWQDNARDRSRRDSADDRNGGAEEPSNRRQLPFLQSDERMDALRMKNEERIIETNQKSIEAATWELWKYVRLNKNTLQSSQVCKVIAAQFNAWLVGVEKRMLHFEEQHRAATKEVRELKKTIKTLEQELAEAIKVPITTADVKDFRLWEEQQSKSTNTRADAKHNRDRGSSLNDPAATCDAILQKSKNCLQTKAI